MRKLVICLVLLLMTSIWASAQRITCQYNNASFSEILKDLNARQDKYAINFVYDELEDFKVTKNIRNQNVPDAIMQLIGFYPIKMTRIGNVIVVECTQKASGKMTGRVVDTHYHPVDFANVALLDVADSSFIMGGVTNENGQFVIPCEAKRVIVKVSCVGYQTACGIYNTGKLGTIFLNEATINLQNVEVKGHRRLYKAMNGGILAQVEGTALGKMGNANDVLKHLPRVIQRNGEYEVLGRGTPLIYIDNRKINNSLELARLNSTDIKSVEIITEPGAEYDASYNAVIRIKTARKQGDGLGVNYRQVYQRNHQDSHQEDLNLNYRYRGLDLFGTLFYCQFRGYQDQHNDNLIYGKRQLAVNEDLIIKDMQKYLSGKFGVNYVFNDNHSLGATYEGYICPKAGGYWNSLMNVYMDGVKTETIDNYYVDTSKKRPVHDVNAYYAGKVGKVNINWDGKIYLIKAGNSQVSTETTGNADSDRLISTDYTSDSKLYATKFVLSMPIGTGTAKIGSEYTNSSRRSIYQVDSEKSYSIQNSDDKVDETNLGVFASYGMKLNRVVMNAGLRYEHVGFDYYNQGEIVAEQSRTYSNFFPNVSVVFPVRNAKVNLGYQMNVNRPSYRQLSGNVQYNSRYYYQKGNPLLQPRYIHAVNMNISYKWLQVYGDLWFSKDMFSQSLELYDEEQMISLYTYRNFKHSHSYSLGFTASPRWGYWQPMLNAELRKQFVEIEGRSYNRPLILASFNNTFEFPHDWLFCVNMDYSSHGHGKTIEWIAQGGVDVSLSKFFWQKRFSAKVEGCDLFASRRTSYRFVFSGNDTSTKKYMDTRKFIVTLGYNFNVAKSKYKGTGAGNAEKNRLY